MSKIRLYGFEECPYCQELKELYDKNGHNYHYIDIDEEKHQEEVKKIMEIAKTESVPIVLVGKAVLAPELSFKSIREAYLLTNKILTE